VQQVRFNPLTLEATVDGLKLTEKSGAPLASFERLGRSFKKRDPGPASAFHTELLERLTRQTKIDDDALVKLARARGQSMYDALIGLGVDRARVSIGAFVQQSAKERLVGSKMSLGAGKKAAVEAAPTTP
jgi:hypothetical protein